MAQIQADQLADLVAGTLRELGRLKIQNIAQELQDYEVVPKWFKKDKLTFDDGYGIQRNLYNRVSGNARFVGLYDKDQVNIPDLIKQLQVPWRHSDAFWAVEYRSDVLMNRGASKIVDLVKLRRKDAMLSMIEKIENAIWEDAPAAADNVLPCNVKYWIVRNNTVGFNGGLPGDHTTVGGVNLTDSPNFKNYTGQYVQKTKADLVKKMRDMHYYTGFKSPVDIQDYRRNADRYRVYVNRATASALEDIGESQNENLGRDIASIDAMGLAFRKHPIVTVARLDADTQDPVYFIDHSVFYPVCLKGNYFRESRQNAPEQHNIVQYFVDLSFNTLCVDRRRCGVLHK